LPLARTLNFKITLVRKFVAPVIRQTFHDKRNNLIEALKRSDEDILIGGDGQYDSPGCCAKYATNLTKKLKTSDKKHRYF
jgi:hypothetical protein